MEESRMRRCPGTGARKRLRCLQMWFRLQEGTVQSEPLGWLGHASFSDSRRLSGAMGPRRVRRMWCTEARQEDVVLQVVGSAQCGSDP